MFLRLQVSDTSSQKLVANELISALKLGSGHDQKILLCQWSTVPTDLCDRVTFLIETPWLLFEAPILRHV